MDNFRLKITNINRSQSLAVDTSAITTFTIVDAPKGPQKPFYVSAGQLSILGEVFGYPSKSYKDLQEVYDLNSGYGVWVSAPYNPIGSKIPVAYVTPAGVFSKHGLITLAAGEYIEDIEEDEISVEGLSALSANPEILIPVGKEAYIFTPTGSAITNILEYDVSTKIGVNLSFDIGAEFADVATSVYHFLNPTTPSTTGGRIMQNITGELGILTFAIPGQAPLDISVESSAGDLILKTGATGTGTEIGRVTIDGSVTKLLITGATSALLTGNYSSYFDIATLDSVWSDSSFLSSVSVYWKAMLGKENVMATIYPKYVSDRSISLSFSESDFNNNIKNTVTEVFDGNQASYTFAWSLDPTAKDGFGNSLEVASKVDNETLVNVHVFKTFDGFSYTKTNSLIGPSDFVIPAVKLIGGSRVPVANVDAHWNLAQDPEFNDVDIFFSIKEPEDTSVFYDLDSMHSLSRFVFPKHIAKSAATAALSKLAFGHNYWATTGEFSRTSAYTNEAFTSPLIGAYVKMACKAIELSYGGSALMYINDDRELGGQLDVSVKKALNDYKYLDDQLRILNDKNYNPIVYGPYGVMVTSHKTCASGELSDWSYIGHESAFLDFQKEVKKLVMIPQIGKPNNDYYRELRATQVEDLLKKRTEGSERIWATGTVDTSTTNVNTTDVLSERKFKIVVSVKVDIFSEGVELEFISEGQV